MEAGGPSRLRRLGVDRDRISKLRRLKCGSTVLKSLCVKDLGAIDDPVQSGAASGAPAWPPVDSQALPGSARPTSLVETRGFTDSQAIQVSRGPSPKGSRIDAAVVQYSLADPRSPSPALP